MSDAAIRVTPVGVVPWPEEFAERYRAAGYWQGRTLGAQLDEWSQRWGGRTALVDGNRRWSYARVRAESDRLAAGFVRLGLRAGDRVVVHLPNIAELVTVCFALFRIGALPVMALPDHRRNEITHLCALSEATAYVTVDRHGDADHRELARRLPKDTLRHVVIVGDAAEFVPLADLATAEPQDLPGPHASDVALFLLSGGTTALPKLIPRTHDDYSYNFRASAEVCALDESTVYLAALPAAHNFALACPGVLGTMHAGGTVVFAPNPSPTAVFDLIENERVTVTALVPPLATLWADAVEWLPTDLSSLRVLQVGGARLAPYAAARVLHALPCQLQQVFGMAEGLLNFTRLDDPPDLILNTQGRPLSQADEIRVVDEAGEPVQPGEVGELHTRGPYTLRGYYRADEVNARSFTPDGFYRTGDLVRRLSSGHLAVEGRISGVINRGGEKVSAEELEPLLLSHPGIRDVAVAAVPDERLGERVCAFVIPEAEAAPTLADVAAHLRELGVAAYKIPERLELVPGWPTTAVGKIDKKQLVAGLTGTSRTAEGS